VLKLKHVLQPLRSIRAAQQLIATRMDMRRFAERGERSFAHDPRYNLQSITEGFAPRQHTCTDDTALLDRICLAYIATVQKQHTAPDVYRATRWWEEIQQRSLRPVMHALLTRDITALRALYSNFFRDPCSTGLVSVPYGMTRSYFGATMKDIHRRVYLSDTLYRIDHWQSRTEGRYPLHDLATPDVGNPFGALVEGTLVGAHSDFRHYCAHRLAGLLESRTSTVVEIGGGFGGTAYYLLRDQPGTKYLDFDVPESIALTSYYLMKALPHLTFLLYGEKPLTQDSIAQADVVLMPLFEMENVPSSSVAITFSVHAMSDLSPEALACYLDNIERTTKDFFYSIGVDRADPSMPTLIGQNYRSFRLKEKLPSGWHDHKFVSASEMERLYRINQFNPSIKATRTNFGEHSYVDR
jgi:putative sugar O-methyltransferase